jgi:hypothetical protein
MSPLIVTIELTPLGFMLENCGGQAGRGVWASKRRAQHAADALNSHGIIPPHLQPDRFVKAEDDR